MEVTQSIYRRMVGSCLGRGVNRRRQQLPELTTWTHRATLIAYQEYIRKETVAFRNGVRAGSGGLTYLSGLNAHMR